MLTREDCLKSLTEFKSYSSFRHLSLISALPFAILIAAIPKAACQTAPFTISTVFPSDNSVATFMQSPDGVALDAAGNLYVSDYAGNQVLRRSTSGSITVVAGTRQAGYSGDGGPAMAAALYNPRGLAFDSAGDLFVVDSGNYRIRRIDTSGIITTVAGNGHYESYPGDDGTIATSAGIDIALSSVAADPAGNIYYTYSGTGVVVQVNTSGIIHHVMGVGLGPNLSGPNTVTTDKQGNLWVGDLSGIYERAVNGTITTIFHTSGYLGNYYMAVSATKGICYTSSYQISCIGASGNPQVIAGNGTPGLSGDGGPAPLASLEYPNGLVFDSNDNLYFADAGNDRVRKVDTAEIITTVIKGTTAITPQRPENVASDTAGNLYISDVLASVVWKLTPQGALSVFAGTGVRGIGGDGDVATDTTLFAPEGVAVDGSGNVYITETGSGAFRVRKVTPDGIIHDFAGTVGTTGFAGDGGPARNATLDTPIGIAVDSAGNVYIADTYNNRIRRVTPDGTITTVGGFGTPVGFQTAVSSGDGGLATAAQLNNPQWITTDANGTVYVVDSGTIRKFSAGGIITTVAGTTGGISGCDSAPQDGPALSVSFCNLTGLAFSKSGDLYAADSGNQRIARIDATGVVSTYAGTGSGGFSGDNGPATAAQLNNPWGIAMDGSGALYISDVGNTRIRRVSPGAPCNLSLSSALSTIDSGAANSTFTVSAIPGCSYSVTSGSSWIHISSGAAGQTTGTVQYAIDLNASGSARSGIITVSASGATTAYVIDQAAPSCQITINPTTASVPFNVASYTLIANQAPAGCAAWQATSDSPWVHITRGAVNIGVPSLDYLVGNNPTAETRTATLTVGNQTQTIIQDPSPIVVTTPTPVSTLNSSIQQFTWTTSGADGFMYELSTSPGAADIVSGFVSGGSFTTGSLPLTGNPVYFRLLYSVNGLWQPSPIDVVYQTAAKGCSPCQQDFAGNGHSDVLLYDPSLGQSYTALSNGNGTYSYIPNLFTPAFDTLRTGDFNGDGKADLVLYNSHNALAYIGMSNGTGTFAFQSLFWSPGYAFVEPGDLNGDGKTDFALYNSATGTMYTGISNGDGTFTYKYTLISKGYTFLRLADFTGNGYADIFLYNATNGSAYLGVGDRTGGFVFHPLSISPGYNLADVGDLNGDGKADVILYNSTNGNAATGISDGVGNFTFTPLIFSPGFTSVRLADFTGDGKADVTVYNKNNSAAYFGTGTGTGTFNFQSLFWSGGYDYVIPEDVNGDRKVDVVLFNSTTGTEYTGISNGNGTFTYAYQYWGIGKVLAR